MSPLVESDIIFHLRGNEFRRITLEKEMSEKDEKKSEKPYTTVRVGGSWQMIELEEKLYKEYNLSLETTTLLPFATVAGVSATAGHGTFRDGSFISLMSSMRIMRADGAIVEIDRNTPGVNFETMRAAHLGLFGVVLDVKLKCIPAQKLQCIASVRSLNETLNEIKSGLFHNDPYVSLMWVPYGDRNTNNVLILRYRPVSASRADQNVTTDASFEGQELFTTLYDLLNLPDFLTHHHYLIPVFMRLVAKSQVGFEDRISISPSYQQLHYLHSYPTNGISNFDMLFKTTGTDCPEIRAVLERTASELESFLANGYDPVMGAVYVRYFNGQHDAPKGGLSTSAHGANEHTCGFDVVSNINAPGFLEFRDRMVDFCVNTLGAKPHWGEYVPMHLDYARMYGDDYKSFITEFSKWNKSYKAQNPFVNDFLEQVLQLSVDPALAASKTVQ